MVSEIPYVTVYTITYNQSDVVRRTIDRLLEQDYPRQRWAIVVLDDGSTDDTAVVLARQARYSPISINVLSVIHEADYMSAARWNQCIAHSPAQTEVFIQIDDVCVRPDFIQQHVKWHIPDLPCLVTGAKFEGPEETWELSSCRRAKLAGPGGTVRETEQFTAVWGASLSFSRQLMETVKEPPHDMPYDERMSGWGYHEVELAYRMQKAGATIVYDPQAGVFHQDHTTESETHRGLDRDQQVTRGTQDNQQYVLAKHTLEQLPRW